MSLNFKAVIFDFGGVLAEEGFREGLLDIGRRNRLDPDQFRKIADDLIYASGYLIGRAGESRYWDMLRDRTGIRGTDAELRGEILKRFLLRPGMVEFAITLRTRGFITAILSDQTNWLDEIDRQTPFFQHFPYIFNSYHIGKSKRDPTLFGDVCAAMGTDPGETLFIDDTAEIVKRASDEGLFVLLFRDEESFRNDFGKLERGGHFT
jgi:putative hydrolase of the HAD superfamily